MNNCFRIQMLTLFFFLVLTVSGNAYNEIKEKEINVTMRMIGHEVLKKSNDHTSLVLPVVECDGRYIIGFDAPFGFHPDELLKIVTTHLASVGIEEHYIVEVETCTTREVVYAYMKGGKDEPDMIPCLGRNQPKACYEIMITLRTPSLIPDVYLNSPTLSEGREQTAITTSSNTLYNLSLLGLPVVAIAGLFLFFLNRKTQEVHTSGSVTLGKYQFHKDNMQLSYKEEIIELTSKETDLLHLLLSHPNETLERDYILKTVWGDEGDYVGRTLDVFVSKLRKKLDQDPDIKIVNIRGVGYKLVEIS